VGATKELELSGIGTIHMQLAGFDLDERAVGKGKAATTWIAVELLPKAHVMNKGATNAGGWRASDLRAYLHDTVYRAIPEVVRGKLVRVRKRQIEEWREWGNSVYQTTEDLVWIPDRAEIFGEDSLYYELFRDKDENRKKQQNGSAAWWWLRSAYYSNNYAIYGVNTFGYGSNGGASYSGGVALGFCL